MNSNSPYFSGNYNTLPNSSNVPNQQYAPNYEKNIEPISNSLPMEQSYIENILRLNKGKVVTIYMTYPDSIEYRDKIYKGIIEESGRDHIVLSDPSTGKWYLLLMIYLDYVEFDEKIKYSLKG